MIKKIGLSLFLVLVALVGLGCSNVLEVENTGDTGEKSRLIVSLGQMGRLVSPETLTNDTITSFVLSGQKAGATSFETIREWTSKEGSSAYSQMTSDEEILVDSGSWTFKLEAKKDGKLVASASETVDVQAGTTTSLNFGTMSYNPTGNGSVSISLSWPQEEKITKVVVGLYHRDDNSTLVEGTERIFQEKTIRSGISYTATDIPVGSYRFKAQVYQGDSVIATYTELVRVAGNLASSASRELKNLNTLYKVTLEWGEGGNLKEGESFPETYNGSVQTIPLPTREQITAKAGYVFVGWYSDEEFTNKYDFTTPVTSSFTLYAGWVMGTEITPTTVEDVINNLTGEDPHSLVATGEWTDGFSRLANELKDESKKVNLDLSGVEGLETIDADAFFGCSSLKSITIPASVKTIEHHAFANCENLAEVTFGEGSKLETIPDGAFFGCWSLESITIPASVKTIEHHAFTNCENLAEVTFGEGSKLETILDGAFFDCSSLKSITIPASVTSIGDSAFNNCISLTSITIPASVTTIGNNAFHECRSLGTVTMEATNPPTLEGLVFNGTADTLQILVPSSSVDDYKAADGWSYYVDKIKTEITPTTVSEVISKLSGAGPYNLEATGNWSSDDLSTLAEKLKDEKKKVNLDLSKVSSLTKIKSQVFMSCTGLASINIPASVEIIEGGAFRNCENLAEVTFGEGSKLTHINSYAFYECKSLTSISLPSTVAMIRDWAFHGCSSLDTVTMEATDPPTLGNEAFYGTAASLQILVPDVDNYKSDEAMSKGWEPYVAKIKE